MKKNCIKYSRPRVSAGKQGFTLIETLVTMIILSMLIPGVLLVLIYLTEQVTSSTEHNDSMNQARLIRQHFISMVNKSDRFSIGNDGKYLYLTERDPTTTNWVETAIWLMSDGSLNIKKENSYGNLRTTKTLTENAYLLGTNKAFTAVGNTGNMVRLQLLIDDTSQATNGSLGTTTSSQIAITTTPRNRGHEQ